MLAVARKSHHKKKEEGAPAAPRGRPKKAAPVIDPSLLRTRSVPVCSPEVQLHASLYRLMGADGVPTVGFTVTPITANVGAERLLQPVPTHLLAGALISLMAPTTTACFSLTAEEWFALASAHTLMHATLERLGCMTRLVSLSVYENDTEAPRLVYCRGFGLAAEPVPASAPRVSPVPQPDVMVSELAACLVEVAKRAAEQAADLAMLLDCLASRESENTALEVLVGC